MTRSRVLSLVLLIGCSYVVIVVFEAIFRGLGTWTEYVAPAIGCGIGMYFALIVVPSLPDTGTTTD